MARSIHELNMRRMACQACIKVIDNMDDPRKADALEHYKKQLAKIDAEITEVTGKPPSIVIGLKTAQLLGKSELQGKECNYGRRRRNST